MGTAAGRLATLRPDLAGAFTEFDLEMNAKGYIGADIFPVIEVSLQADNPGRVPLEQLLSEGDTHVGSRSGYNTGDFEFERWQYATDKHGWKEPVSARDRKRYQNLIEPEVIAVARAMGVVMRNFEKRIAGQVFNTTTYTTANGMRQNVTNPWSDFVNSRPIDDVRVARQNVWNRTGYYPNTLVANMEVFINLQHNEQVIDRIRAAGAGDKVKATDITAAQLAQVFSVEKFCVANSAQNTAGEGLDRQISQIWSRDFAAVCHVAQTSDHREPCVGRTFHWGEDGSTIGGTVVEYWDEDIEVDWYKVKFETDEVTMYEQMSQLIGGVTTAISGPTPP